MDALLDAAVLKRQAGGGRFERGAMRTCIDEEGGLGNFRPRQNLVEVKRICAVTPQESNYWIAVMILADT